MHKALSVLFVLFSCVSFGQVYEDYLGAGQQIGVKVTGSPAVTPDTSLHTISGTALIPDMAGASRFLAQATLGTNYEEIEHVSTIGIDAWLNEQFALPIKSYVERFDTINKKVDLVVPNIRFKNTNLTATFTFYDFIFRDPDFLRQKVGFAFSQIFVFGQSIGKVPFKMMGLQNIYYQGAFGNYRDMLNNVTYNSGMSEYLSYLNNRREDVIGKIYPDENYAREVMQLFSIGLIKLNLDGTPIKDSNGNNIPTYDNENIEELAKVFTGMTLNGGDFNKPLIHNDELHSVTSKHIIDDVVIPEGQSGSADVEQALDALFNHPNVGPFIGLRLIQQLVKSNPTPAYIKRVAMVFNDNGEGLRGDLKAMIKAILLDPEARNCDWIGHPKNGKLIQPIERFITLFKAFDISSPKDLLWLDDRLAFGIDLKQAYLDAPTVFNFFSPFYAEDKIIAPLGLLSPEFQILDNITSIHYLNTIENSLKVRPFPNQTRSNGNKNRFLVDNSNNPFLDFTDEIALYQASGIEALLDRLDILICRGQLSQGVKNIIINTIEANIVNVSGYDETDVMHDALYYIFLSPDYMIQE